MSYYRYDKTRLQRLQLKKLNRQEAKMEKEMFVGNVRIFYLY